MNTRSIERRLKKIEKKIKTQDNAEILELIRQGAFYDELTPEQKDLYCEYQGYDREVMETVRITVLDCEGLTDPDNYFHFPLERKHKQTDKIDPKVLEDVERIVLGCEDQEREQMEKESQI